MRTRVTLFDDAHRGGDEGEYTGPVVVQSLDVPMIGRPDPGPAQSDGDLRIPGTSIRLRVSFLADESAAAVAAPSRGYFNDMGDAIYRWALGKGFWTPTTNTGEKIALMHSELSEALEEVRHHDNLTEIRWDEAKTNEAGMAEPTGFGIELADVMIRVMDTAAAKGVDLDEAIAVKRAYNQNRPHMHGGKRF